MEPSVECEWLLRSSFSRMHQLRIGTRLIEKQDRALMALLKQSSSYLTGNQNVIFGADIGPRFEILSGKTAILRWEKLEEPHDTNLPTQRRIRDYCSKK